MRARRAEPLSILDILSNEATVKRYSSGRLLFMEFIRGFRKWKIAERHGISTEHADKLITEYVKYLWAASEKWRQAETRCRALGVEMRLLRLGKDPKPDRPIESLNPPINILKHFKRAGVETVNQLRAVDQASLTAFWRFPQAAIDWAILVLDKQKLSHALVPGKIPVLRGAKVKPPKLPTKHSFKMIVVGRKKFYRTDDGRMVTRIRKRDR